MANAIQAAPIGLVATISTATFTGTTFATTAIIMTTLQKTLITAVLVTTVGAGIYEAKQAANARAEVQTLQQAQAPLAEQNRQLQFERDRATNRIEGLKEEVAKNQKNNLELLKLRNELTMLKRQPVAQSSIADDSWEVSTDRKSVV